MTGNKKVNQKAVSPPAKGSNSPILKPGIAKKGSPKKSSKQVFITPIPLEGNLVAYQFRTLVGNAAFNMPLIKLLDGGGVESDDLNFIGVFDYYEDGKPVPQAKSGTSANYSERLIFCVTEGSDDDLLNNINKKGEMLRDLYSRETLVYKSEEHVKAVYVEDAEGLPEKLRCLKEVTSEANTAEIVAFVFDDQITDGTFWEQGKEMIPLYFGDYDVKKARVLIRNLHMAAQSE